MSLVRQSSARWQIPQTKSLCKEFLDFTEYVDVVNRLPKVLTTLLLFVLPITEKQTSPFLTKKLLLLVLSLGYNVTFHSFPGTNNDTPSKETGFIFADWMVVYVFCDCNGVIYGWRVVYLAHCFRDLKYKVSLPLLFSLSHQTSVVDGILTGARWYSDRGKTVHMEDRNHHSEAGLGSLL